MKYIICSGWWSSEPADDGRKERMGDESIRAPEFHHLWYKAIIKYTNPEKIIIIDSCSPNPPPLQKEDSRIEYIRLNTNPGHSTNHSGVYCGYTRAILLGLEYVLQCDADYFVYVEQDALIYGNGIVENCISKMEKDIMLGSGQGTPQKIQQSFFIIKKRRIREFVNRLHKIKIPDSNISPEEKFCIAANRLPVDILLFLRNSIFKTSLLKDLKYKIDNTFRDYDHVPFGYGRKRPLDLSVPFFYFQHGSRKEIREFSKLIEQAS